MKKGFTLIELLVVISIIGILTSLILVNMMGIRERGRDAARKSDISQIQKALELYKNSQTSPAYPPPPNWHQALEQGNFIKKVPHDPRCDWNEGTGACNSSWPDYSYSRDETDFLQYTLIACLENASDPQKDSMKASYCSGAKASFSRNEP